MLVTEEEAKKRWCPFARYTLEQGATISPARNRWVGEDTQLKPTPACCIAYECMAWREVTQYRRTLDCEWEAFQHTQDDYTRVVGFCGLAGKP